MYFDYFPTLEYKFQNGNTLELIDIFRKVSFTQTTLANDSIFDTYYVTNGANAEITSFNLYSSSQYSWVLFSSNRMLNPHTDWPREYTSFLTELNSKYNGTAYYICRIPDLLPGDVMIKITKASCSGTTANEVYTSCVFSYESPIVTYKIVKEWNQKFRYLVAVGGGSGSFSVNDTFAILRKDSNGNYKAVNFRTPDPDVENIDKVTGPDGYTNITIDGNEFTIFRIAKIDEEKNAATQFMNSGAVESPYRKVSSLNTAGSLTAYYSNSNTNINSYQSTTPVFANANDFSGTLLDAYVRGVLPSSITVKTPLILQLEENEKRYSVRALKPRYLEGTIGLFEKAINSNQGRVLSIELNV
jgi:hypothetical protein